MCQQVSCRVTQVEDGLIRELRVPALRFIRANDLVEISLYVIGMRRRTHYAQFELSDLTEIGEKATESRPPQATTSPAKVVL